MILEEARPAAQPQVGVAGGHTGRTWGIEGEGQGGIGMAAISGWLWERDTHLLFWVKNAPILMGFLFTGFSSSLSITGSVWVSHFSQGTYTDL